MKLELLASNSVNRLFVLIDCSDILEEDEMHRIGDGHCDKNLFVYHCWFDAGDCYGITIYYRVSQGKLSDFIPSFR